jgi:long-chain acyl-CoA synthetase
MNPAEWLHRTALRAGARPALLIGDRTILDYAGFRDAAARLGTGLAARGVSKDDRVAVFMGNRSE